MSYEDRIAAVVDRDAQPGESFEAGLRVGPRGTMITLAVVAGIGAAIGSFSGGVLAAGIGGGVGAAVGYALAELLARRHPVANRASLALALTNRRVLVYLRSALNNRPTRLLASVDRASVSAVEVGPKRFLFPRHLTVVMEDGSRVALEAVPMDRPERLAEAIES